MDAPTISCNEFAWSGTAHTTYQNKHIDGLDAKVCDSQGIFSHLPILAECAAFGTLANASAPPATRCHGEAIVAHDVVIVDMSVDLPHFIATSKGVCSFGEKAAMIPLPTVRKYQFMHPYLAWLLSVRRYVNINIYIYTYREIVFNTCTPILNNVTYHHYAYCSYNIRLQFCDRHICHFQLSCNLKSLPLQERQGLQKLV